MHFDRFFCWQIIHKTIQISANVPTRSLTSGLKTDLYSSGRKPSASSATLVGQMDRSSIRQSFSLSHTSIQVRTYCPASILWPPPKRFSAYKSNCHGNVVTIPSRQMSGLHNSISELKRSLFKAILNWVSHTITEAVSRLAVQNYTVICQP